MNIDNDVGKSEEELSIGVKGFETASGAIFKALNQPPRKSMKISRGIKCDRVASRVTEAYLV